MDLKPCPFCGTNPTLNEDYDNHYVWCSECADASPIFPYPEEATKHWNTRPREDALQAEVEALKLALKPFADFRLEGFDGATVLEVTHANPDNPASRIEPIWTIHFQNARTTLKGAPHE